MRGDAMRECENAFLSEIEMRDRDARRCDARMRECKLILGNLSLVEMLSRREKAGKLECSKNMKKWLRFQRRPRLVAKRAC